MDVIWWNFFPWTCLVDKRTFHIYLVDVWLTCYQLKLSMIFSITFHMGAHNHQRRLRLTLRFQRPPASTKSVWWNSSLVKNIEIVHTNDKNSYNLSWWDLSRAFLVSQNSRFTGIRFSARPRFSSLDKSTVFWSHRKYLSQGQFKARFHRTHIPIEKPESINDTVNEASKLDYCSTVWYTYQKNIKLFDKF